jgi:hypothetical protein
MKTLTACSGVTGVVLGFGTTTSTTLFRIANYNLKLPVADNNILSAPPTSTAETTAPVHLNARVFTSVENIDQIVTGCKVELGVLVSSVP